MTFILNMNGILEQYEVRWQERMRAGSGAKFGLCDCHSSSRCSMHVCLLHVAGQLCTVTACDAEEMLEQTQVNMDAAELQCSTCPCLTHVPDQQLIQCTERGMPDRSITHSGRVGLHCSAWPCFTKKQL